MSKLEVFYVDIENVIPYENNPRINDDAVEKVANSIREFGWQQPIVVDKHNVIIAGHTRLKAARMLGESQVPVVFADLSDKRAKAYRLADNKTSEFAEWDFSLLEQELLELEEINFDMEQFGFEEIFNGLGEEDEEEDGGKGSMKEKYLVPPFSLIYGNKPDWLARKRAWVKFGIRSEIGRGGGVSCINSQSGWADKHPLKE